MQNKTLENTCRVCGYIFSEFKPWGDDGQTASFAHCPCCFIEFGFDDIRIEIIREKRKEWIENGYLWYEPNKRPTNWNPKKQLENIPEEFK